MNIKIKKHITYWVLPSLFLIICICVYFFDVLGLAYIVAPEFNRELGLIENTQLLIILCMLVVSFNAYRKEKIRLYKYLFLISALFSVFVFLEEIDYGIHLVDFFSGKSNQEVITASQGNQIRKIHNQGKLTHYIKLSAYIAFVLFLVILPLIATKLNITNRFLNWVIPSKYFIPTLFSMVLLNRFALFFDNSIEHHLNSSLNGNISEFEEVFIYYIMLLYLLELINKRPKVL